MTDLAFYESGLSDGPVLVLGHALGADHRIWNEAAAILERDFRVLRWDQPGHGASALLGEVGPRRRGIGEIVDSLLAGLDQLGVKEAHFAGVSLGGMVSLAVAQVASTRVLSLSILDAGPSLPPASSWVEKAAQVRRDGMGPLVDATMDRWFATDCRGEGYRRTRDTFVTCDPEGYAQCCEVIAGTDLSGALQAVQVPTLVLTGEKDPGMTPTQARELAEQIPGAAQPVIIGGSGHISCLHDPAMVAEAIVATTRRSR